MEIINNLAYGFSISLLPINLLHCFVGVLIGTLVGVLPGLGPVAAISILLPMTFHVSSPTSALIMLAGIYYGAQYGGSTTSILINIPGEATSVVTCLDGYQMARQGRAGAALGIAAFGSFIGGTLAIIGLMLVAPPLARFALRFGPPEYCALMFLAFTVLSYIASGSMVNALMMAGLGLLLGSVGMDFMTGNYRFSYGILALEDGLGLVPVCMGLFGISEVLLNVEETATRQVFEGKIKNIYPNLQDWKDSIKPIGRGTLIGFFLGILPGAGPLLASFMSYIVEKKLSKHPERFGKGAIEGVAGPETANNAGATAAFVPMLTLAIPATATMAILLGTLMMYGVQPGPMLMKKAPEIFWGVVTSMYTGNVMLFLLNLPLIAIWVKVLKVPYPILFPLILLFCLTGAYSINNSITDVIIMNIFGIVGYIMKKVGFEGGPFILAFILGPMFETTLRQSLMMSRGDFSIFLTRPISLILLIVAFLVLISPLLLRKRLELGTDAT
ncbi:MAG: transporter [Deltaproteobacteria bacterium RBG_13_53_10]|nr:MAG: transporter [Deltaproteobacteria bacterium RBG_13_53_10]